MSQSSWEFEEIFARVEEKFIVLDKYISDHIVVFTISEETRSIKEKFVKLVDELKSIGFIPFLRKEGDRLILRVARRVEERAEKRSKIYLLLLFATIGTIFLDGYIRVTDPLWLKVSELAGIPVNPLVQALLFLIAMFGIIGIHELGHLVTLITGRVKATFPYFIPGIPGVFPTFGAVIVQKEPLVNRDQLFNVGISGPILGLIATLIVTFFSSFNLIPITGKIEKLVAERTIVLKPPILYSLIVLSLHPEYSRTGVLLDPLSFAAIVGMIVVFFNTLPAWELDGGHMSRAVLGPKHHQLATLISIGILALAGFMPMALLVLLMWLSTGGATAAPLDDYSPVSWGKKALFILSLVIAFLCMPIPI